MKNTDQKNEIRKKYLEIRASIPLRERTAAERVIGERVLGSTWYGKAQAVYCYVSFRDEVSTSGIIRAALQDRKRVAVPKVLGRREMEFRYIEREEQLEKGRFGIMEPVSACPRAPFPSEGCLVLMPGAAFDRDGGRIGYGGGYYDSYLSGCGGCLKAALAFSLQILSHIPAERHDMCADIIITEKELIRCSKDFREIR